MAYQIYHTLYPTYYMPYIISLSILPLRDPQPENTPFIHSFATRKEGEEASW